MDLRNNQSSQISNHL